MDEFRVVKYAFGMAIVMLIIFIMSFLVIFHTFFVIDDSKACSCSKPEMVYKIEDFQNRNLKVVSEGSCKECLEKFRHDGCDIYKEENTEFYRLICRQQVVTTKDKASE